MSSVDNNTALTWGDFALTGSFNEIEGIKWDDRPTVNRFVIDENTGKRYWNQDRLILRIKLLLAATFVTLGHIFMAPAAMLCRAIRVVFLVSFLPDENGRYDTTDTTEKVLDFTKDLFLAVATPAAIPLFILACAYGIIWDPLRGSVLYASINQFIYGPNVTLTPCFCPGPESHLLRGDPNKSTSF